MRHGKLNAETSGGNREYYAETEKLLEELEKEAIKKEEKYRKLRNSSSYEKLLKVYSKDINELCAQVDTEASNEVSSYKLEIIDKLIKEQKEIIAFLY